MAPGLGSTTAIPDGAFLFPGTTPEQTPPTDGGLFETLALQSLNEAAALERGVHTQIASGVETGDMAMSESVIAMRKADLAMRLMLQVQRKLVDAWNELRNMQV